jgi:6-phosphogluconolactonase
VNTARLHVRPADPSPSASILSFVSPGQAAAALAARIVSDLEQAVAQRGHASLAVPGGTTPAAFLRLLGYRNLDWRRIAVTLTDERWVPPTHERSNAALVSRTLGAAGRPYRWFPLFRAGTTAEMAVPRVEYESGSLGWPLDVVVLGMGEDGHVASLFPGSNAGLDDAASRRFVAVTGPDGMPRISLTLTALREARSVYLLFHGDAKLAVFERAAREGLPVARLLAARHDRIVAFTSR